MTDYKTIIGYAAAGLTFLGYVPYFWGIYKKQTLPHAFSWLVWSVLNGIGFVAQTTSGAGTGAWALGITCLLNFVIGMIGFSQGKVKFSRFDWIALFFAIL